MSRSWVSMPYQAKYPSGRIGIALAGVPVPWAATWATRSLHAAATLRTSSPLIGSIRVGRASRSSSALRTVRPSARVSCRKGCEVARHRGRVSLAHVVAHVGPGRKVGDALDVARVGEEFAEESTEGGDVWTGRLERCCAWVCMNTRVSTGCRSVS